MKPYKVHCLEFFTHWWADFPTDYCPIDRGSEVPMIRVPICSGFGFLLHKYMKTHCTCMLKG